MYYRNKWRVFVSFVCFFYCNKDKRYSFVFHLNTCTAFFTGTCLICACLYASGEHDLRYYTPRLKENLIFLFKIVNYFDVLTVFSYIRTWTIVNRFLVVSIYFLFRENFKKIPPSWSKIVRIRIKTLLFCK